MNKCKKSKSKQSIQFAHDNYKSENVFKDLNLSRNDERTKTYRKTPYKTKRNFVKSASDSSILEEENNKITPSKSELSPKKKIRISEKLKFECEDEDEELENKELKEFVIKDENTENSDSNDSFSFSKLCSMKSFDLNDSFIDAVPTDELFNSSSLTNLDDSIIKSAKVYEDVEKEPPDSPEDDFNEETQTSYDLETKEEPPLNKTKYFTIGTYFNLPEGKLAILPPNKEIIIYGLIEIQVLYGKIDMLGHEFEKNSPSVKIYSPKGSSHLTIKNVHENSAKLSSIEYLAPSLQKFEDIRAANRIRRNSSIFLCRLFDDPQFEFVQKHIPQIIIPPSKFVFEPQISNSIKSSSDWYKLVDDIDLNSRLMIVGGKGVGKSTFFRFTINRLLNRFQKVRVIDLDPGQPEFTVPGVISVNTVEHPICGPNYTHLLTPDCAFLCNIDVGHNPQLYLKTVNHLVAFCNNQLPHLPTVINYMGFSQGLGINILAAAVHYVQPTNIAEIQSPNDTKNFKYPLNVATFEEMALLFVDGKTLNINEFVLHQIMVTKPNYVGWQLQSKQAREMCLLAYLGRLMKPILDESLPIYEINLSDIKMVTPEKKSVPPAVVSANIVALCNLSDNGLFNCYGWGIVRGIDTTNGKLYLITPETDALEFVHYLVVGVVPLPPSIYMTVEESGSVPYVMYGDLEFLGKIIKRSFRPLNNAN